MEYIDVIERGKEKESLIVYDKKEIIISEKNNLLGTIMGKPEIYKKMFDECYKQKRFEEYEYWISIGMAIKNTFEDDESGINLFDYYSAKGSKYEGYEKTKYKFKSLSKKNKTAGYTVATIYYYAIEDNKPKFIEIMNNNEIELEQTDICNYLKIIAGNRFVYKIIGENNYKLYCYNGKYWQNDDVLIKKCISTELYDFLKMVLVEVHWNSKEFHQLKMKLDNLKKMRMKRDIIETYKEYGVNNTIKFDEKWWLLGFTNIVYDMEEECFRNYRYDDYISITTGYDWREPTEDEIETVNGIINQIMPILEERELYLQLLCTCLDGQCIERFLVFNGNGGNGKGLINDLLLLALGNHGLIGNNAILFESSRTGSNPEKANIHKKRLVIFREPSERNKFENSVMKELTGGGTFSARTHHEKETEKSLNATIIVECNKKPNFSEEPTNAEIRRIIDVYFGSTFTNDKELINEEKNYYEAKPEYKTKEFQEKHKYALLKILMREHIKFNKINKRNLIIPKSIDERTRLYLEMSCNILQWFKDNYECTNGDTVYKLKDIHKEFIESMYYCNLTKNEKRKYNKSYFIEYFETNIYLRKYFVIKKDAQSIKGWIKKEIIEEN